ncbi:hypothetical protein U1738_19860 [Sphingomonas sp. GB1N7]
MFRQAVRASAQTEADARATGGGPLIGTMRFRDLVEEERGLWSGSVLVPDIGQTVSGTIEQIDANTLIGEDFVIPGLGCKTQT